MTDDVAPVVGCGVRDAAILGEVIAPTVSDACEATPGVEDATCWLVRADGSTEAAEMTVCGVTVGTDRITVADAPADRPVRLTWTAFGVDPSGNRGEASCEVALPGLPGLEGDDIYATGGAACAASDTDRSPPWLILLALLALPPLARRRRSATGRSAGRGGAQ